jgi:CBS domain-containing protein
MKTCNDIMTTNPTCCLASDSVTKAAQVMKKEDVGAVPVVDDSTTMKLVGIITDRDIALQVVAAGKDCNAAISTVMSRNPVTCRADDAMQNVMDRMSQHQVRRIPVVDGKGRVIGIVSQADLAIRADQPELTADMLEDISQPVA